MVRFASNKVIFGLQYCSTHCHDAPITIQGVTEAPPEPVYQKGEGIFEPQIRTQRPFRGNIVMPNGLYVIRTVRRGSRTIFMASLYDINMAIEPKNLKERPLEKIVPEQYHQFLLLFSKVLADRLPPHQPGIDYEVRLKEGEISTGGRYIECPELSWWL